MPGVDVGPRILGAHVEGPFISPARLGAHPAGARRDPDAGLMRRLLEAGPVAHVTLAPELPGALELVDLLVAEGVVVACGHSDATAGEAAAAFARGALTVTHLFNAMRPLRHRDPGIAGAALADRRVTVQLIVDGTHLADEVVRIAFAAARGRVALVTDAIAAATLGDGSYRLGGVDVEVRDGVARGAGGMLAGSVVTMDESVRRVHALGVPLEEALAAASANGSLAPGSRADVVVLDDRLEVRRVLVARCRKGPTSGIPRVLVALQATTGGNRSGVTRLQRCGDGNVCRSSAVCTCRSPSMSASLPRSRSRRRFREPEDRPADLAREEGTER